MTGVDRRQIKSASQLGLFLPWQRRRSDWENLEISLRISLPALATSGPLSILRLTVSIGLSLRIVTLWKIPSAQGTIWCMLGLIAGWIFTSPLQREFPGNVKTVGDLARLIAARNFGKFAAECGGGTAGQAWQIFQSLVADLSTLSNAEVRRDLRFPEDLGVY